MAAVAGRPYRNKFMFATGVEGSYPVVPTPDGKCRRRDEFALSKHYEKWEQDFELVKQMGIEYLRYGPPYYRSHIGPGRYDWDWADQTFGRLKELGIQPIADLCHFGVPDWAGNFQNDEWPCYFAEYAKAFAERYPWVDMFTPVNEILVAAEYSAWRGAWNEALKSDEGFVRALVNLSKANVLAMMAILEVNPDASFIQSESTQYFHAQDPKALNHSYFLNERRFLALDLTYAYPITANMFRYLMEHGMSEKEYDWFQQQQVKAHCVLGTDYYQQNEHVVGADGSYGDMCVTLGYYPVARQYFDRYHLPMMHTETNIAAPDAVAWLMQTWSSVFRLKQDGIPVLGFTWYSLTDQVDWDTGLVEFNHHVNPYGLFDLDRKMRDVGRAYQDLIEAWKDILPMESLSVRHGRW